MEQKIRFAVRLTLGVALAAAFLLAGSCDGTGSGPEGGGEEIVEADRDSLGFWEAHPDVYDEAIGMGVRIVNLDDPATYFCFWFPPGFDGLSEKRVLVMLHGTDGVAYRSLLRLSTVATEEGFGIVAVQWGWPPAGAEEYAYLDPEETHEIITSALEYLGRAYGVDTSLSGWDGFSRAATRCAVHAFLDREAGTNYFTCFMAISGGCMATYPPMAELLGGVHGAEPIAGSRFYFWCGSADLDSLRCASMDSCSALVESLGGQIDIFAVADGFGHAGYYLEEGRPYQREAVALWKSIER